jgi:uncharacterized protein (DUF2384 family)
MLTTQVNPNIAQQAGAALKVVLNIFDKWKCSGAEKEAILGMSHSTFHRNSKDPLNAKLSNDQIERISYILNMHQALRMVFSNNENIYGFMRMENNNPYFNGKTPLSLIATGSFGALYEVFKRIDVMRGGQW